MWLAEAAESHSEMGLLEDAARALFKGDARWERFPQRRRTQAWLERLAGDAAAVVVPALRDVPSASKWYLDEGWRPRTNDPTLRAALFTPPPALLANAHAGARAAVSSSPERVADWKLT